MTQQPVTVIEAGKLYPPAVQASVSEQKPGKSSSRVVQSPGAPHYDSNAIRDLAAQRGRGKHPTEEDPNQQLPFNAWVYKPRNLVERFFNELKHFRGIATRYDRDPLNFLAAIKLVSVRIWLKSYESAT